MAFISDIPCCQVMVIVGTFRHVQSNVSCGYETLLKGYSWQLVIMNNTVK